MADGRPRAAMLTAVIGDTLLTGRGPACTATFPDHYGSRGFDLELECDDVVPEGGRWDGGPARFTGLLKLDDCDVRE